MGIKGLRSRLQPFARLRSLDNTSVVVDGPSLAYHILALYMRGDQPALYQPKCLVDSLFQWLAILEKHGVKIEAFYFDGLLPTEKLPTRMQREVARCRRSSVFFDTHPKGCPLPVICPEEKFVDPLSQPCSSSTTPATPFVVAAILEALVDCPLYQDRTFVVPGEADIYCATHASRGQNISVLSGDSDLVVHNLGERGGLVYFSDIEERDHGTVLACLRYEAVNIEGSLGLPPKSLIKFSFELPRMTYTDTRSIAKRVLGKIDTCKGTEFEHFAEPYLRTVDIAVVSGTSHVPSVFLDARSSETVLQYLESVSSDGHMPDPLYHFLPALVDSNFDFSGWIPSLPLRQIAYSLLPYLRQSDLCEVREFRRTVQTSSKGTAVDILPANDLEVFIDAVSQGLSGMGGQSKHDALLMTVLTLEIEHAISLERVPLSFKMLSSNQMIVDGRNELVSWPLMHFRAQIEACVYSMRMLRQLLEFAKAINSLELLPTKCLLQVTKIVEAAPKLTELPSIREIESFFVSLFGSSRLKDLCQRYDIQEPRIKAKARKSQPDAGRVRKSFPISGNSKTKSTLKNQFDLLGDC